ncbi:MAG TPA: hypothetical protein VIO56_03630 [Methylotenera sp.]
MMSNPFAVSSPESMDANEMTRLFVPLSETFEIDSQGHIFIHGHRGCGKSMLLRQMTPDCLMLSTQNDFHKLPYLGIYATIKHTDLDLSDFERIDNEYAGLILAEHSLTLFVASKTLQSLLEHSGNSLDNTLAKNSLEKFCKSFVINPLKHAGAAFNDNEVPGTFVTYRDVLKNAISKIDLVYSEMTSYLRKIGIRISDGYIPYSGTIVGYRDFLFPLLCELTQLECMPKNKPVYLLLDDADNLSFLQTQVLNNWVSFRSGNKVSFKISTQKSYKTWRTTNKQLIEAPHDFKEVDISTIYTGKHSSEAYPKWVAEVVTKRLSEHGIDVSAESFFPADQKQEDAIKELAKLKIQTWEKEGKGYRPGDDAYRYSRPDYIKGLGAKQVRTYSYSGFKQLVHVSSGIIRYFLDSAAAMYAEQIKLVPGELRTESIKFISTSIQDNVLRENADELMFGTLDKLVDDARLGVSKNSTVQEFKQLRNLVQALGGIFQAILMSDRSERRVFSIALSDSPPDEIMRIFDLGVIHGYLYEGAIGTKDGRGRTRRYVLTRRLAPFFKLDPTGFSGYLFVTTQLLQLAIQNPTKAINDFEKNRLGSVIEETQLSLGL